MKKLILICFSLFAVLSAQAFEIKNITTAGLLDSSYENDFSSNDVASIVSDNGDVTFLSKAFDPNSAEDMEGHYYNSSTDTSSSIVALKNSEFDPINPGLPVDDGKDYREIASYDSLLISVRDNKENSQLPGEDAQSLFINSTPLIFSGIDKFSAIRLVGNASNATLTFLDQNQKINLVSFVKSAGTWSMVADSHHFLPMLNVTSAVTTASGLFTFYVSSNQLRVYNNNSDSSISLASANQVYLSADSRALFWLYGEDLSMVRVDDVSDWGNLTTDSFQNQIMSVASNVKSGRQMKPAFSESGQFVVYLKEKTVDGKVLNQVYFKNLATFVETQISVISAYDFYHDSFNPSISLNGKYVTFSAIKTNLPPPGFGTRSEDTVHHLWRVTMADSDLESASSKVGFPKIDLAEGEITLVEGGLSVSNDGNHFLALTHFNSNGNDTNRRIYVIDSTYYGRYVAHVNSLNLNDSEFDSLQLSEDGKTVVKLETGLLHLAIIMDNTIGDFTQISPALGTFSVSADGTTVAFQDVNSQLKLYNSTDQSTIDLGAGSNPVISASGERIYYLDGTTLKVQTLQNGAWTKDAVFSMASVLPEFSVSYNGCFVVYEKSGNWYRYNLLSGVEKALDETEVTLSSGAGWSVGKAGSDFKLVNHRLDSSSIIPDSTGLREVLISGDGSQMAKVDSLGNLTIESYSVPDSGSYTVSASESLVAHNATPINFHLNIAGGRDADLELVGMPTATKGSIAQISPLKFEYTPVDDNHEIVTLSFTLRDRNLVEHQLSVEVLPDLYIDGQGDTTPDGIDIVLSIKPDGSVDFDSNYDSISFVTGSESQYSDLVTSTDGSISFVPKDLNADVLGYEDVILQFGSGNDVSEREVRLEYGRGLDLQSGWNLVGIPYALSDKSIADLTAASFSTWGWDGTQYVAVTSFERGKAYWIFSMPPEKIDMPPPGPGSTPVDVVDPTISLAPNVVAPANNSALSAGDKMVALNHEWNLFAPVGYGKALDSVGYVWRWDNAQQIYQPTQTVESIDALEGIWQKEDQGWDRDVDGNISPILNQ